MPFKKREDKQKYQREWLQNRKDKFYKGKKCKSCGSTKNLTLHHRDPGKKVSHKIWSWAPEKFWSEVKKCDVLCEKCHEEKTSKQQADNAKKDD